MNLNEYLKTTVTLHFVLVVLSFGGTDGVYLYYDYVIDGVTARIICESNRGILPAFNSSKLLDNSSKLLDKPHWIDNNTCNISGCAVEVNGSCQSKNCTERQKLFCQVDSTCISEVKSRQNVSEMNSSILQMKGCAETCCSNISCLGISYENNTCLMYEAGATEKIVFAKENTVKKMEYKEYMASGTISPCLTHTGTLNTGASHTGSLRPTSRDLHSTVAFSSASQYINPTSTYVAVTSSVGFSVSVDETTKVVSASSIVQPTKPTLDLSSTLAPSFSSECLCQCQSSATSLSEEESKSKMSKLRAELTIPKKDLSSTIRKKTSAPDYRVSATSIGLVGVGIMCVVFGGIVVMDLGMMVSHLRILYKNVFGHCRS